MKKYILPILFASCGLTLAGCKSPAKPTPTPSKTLSSISLSGTYKTEYYVGEELDLTGLVVTAHYSDESTKVVTAYSTYGFDSSEVDDEVVVTVSYTETQVTKTENFTVSVAARSQEIHDITLKVTVSGIDTYEEGHAYIWMNAPILGTATSWGSQKLTQDSENANLWTITLEDVTLDEVYEYDLYYGSETAPDWDNGKFILESGEHAFIDTAEGVYEYTTSATFHVPEVTGQVVIDLYITASVEETAEGTPVTTLNEDVYLWAWTNVTGDDPVVFTRGADEKWHRQFTVDLVEGKADLKVTPLLSLASTEFDGNWDYKHGAWEGDPKAWVPWNAASVKEGGVTEDSDVDFTAHFNGQPVPSTETVSFRIEMTPSYENDDEVTTDTVFYISGSAKLFGGTGSNWLNASMQYDSEKTVWYHQVTDIDLGTYEYTFFAFKPGTSSFVWDDSAKCNQGNYSITVTASYTGASNSPSWNSKPVQPATVYTVTFNVAVSGQDDSTSKKIVLGASQWHNDNSWIDLTATEGGYTYTYESATEQFYFCLYFYVGGDFYVRPAAWECFSLTVTDESKNASVTVTIDALTAAGELGASAITASTGCTIA